MNERQDNALTHPITDPSTTDISRYRRTEQQPDGNLLVTVLAVDRWLAMAAHMTKTGLPSIIENPIQRALNIYIQKPLPPHISRSDIAQEIRIQVLLALPTFQGRDGAPIDAWVYRVARNVIIETYRKEATLKRPSTTALEKWHDHPDPAGDSDNWAAILDARNLCRRLLREVSTRERQVLVLRLAYGYSAKETGEIVDCSAGNVAIIQFRALERLRQFVKNEWGRAS